MDIDSDGVQVEVYSIFAEKPMDEKSVRREREIGKR
jgi:hypothetical protein